MLRSPRKPTRKISKIPFKVLDAPELQDDFYLNLVDWSSLNVLSVGLGTCVYLWSACTSQVGAAGPVGAHTRVCHGAEGRLRGGCFRQLSPAKPSRAHEGRECGRVLRSPGQLCPQRADWDPGSVTRLSGGPSAPPTVGWLP